MNDSYRPCPAKVTINRRRVLCNLTRDHDGAHGAVGILITTPKHLAYRVLWEEVTPEEAG